MVEHDGRDAPTPGAGTAESGEAGNGGVSRNQNVAYVLPNVSESIHRALGPLVGRLDAAERDVQLIVVTPDAEVAEQVAAAVLLIAGEQAIDVVAATGARRAARVIRSRPPQVVTGTPNTFLELIRGAAIKLHAVRGVCVAWADEIITVGALPALEALMAELPKDSARTVIASELTPDVEGLLERYARRARRVMAPAPEADHGIDVEYLSVSARTRLASLQRLLDEADPASAVVVVHDTESEARVRGLLAALGYGGADAAVRVGHAALPGTDLVVLFDLPASTEALQDATRGAARTVALVQPRQVSSLHRLSAGGAVRPTALAGAAARARDRDERLRAELRSELVQARVGRDVLALESLLDEFDGIEIAAAAVRLLERERAAREGQTTGGGASAAREREPAGSMVRIFLTIGSRDSIRPGDLVGAIANTAGITSDQLGKVDIRESHSIVEVASAVVDSVIERVTGMTIKGRRVVARRERDRGEREGGERAGGSGPREGGRDARGGPRGPRGPGGPRGTGGPRGAGGSRGPGGARGPHGRPAMPRDSGRGPRRGAGDRE